MYHGHQHQAGGEDRHRHRSRELTLELGQITAVGGDGPDAFPLELPKLHAVGFLELAGYLGDAEMTETLEPIDLDELERLVADRTVDVIDVREPH